MHDYHDSRSSGPRSGFLNRRDWHDFVSAAQSAVAYPKIVDALKRGREWLAQASEQKPWAKKGHSLTQDLATDLAARLEAAPAAMSLGS